MPHHSIPTTPFYSIPYYTEYKTHTHNYMIYRYFIYSKSDPSIHPSIQRSLMIPVRRCWKASMVSLRCALDLRDNSIFWPRWPRCNSGAVPGDKDAQKLPLCHCCQGQFCWVCLLSWHPAAESHIVTMLKTSPRGTLGSSPFFQFTLSLAGY